MLGRLLAVRKGTTVLKQWDTPREGDTHGHAIQLSTLGNFK